MPRVKDPYYNASAEPELIFVPELPFIAIDGTGDPNTSEDFQHAVEALYGISYGIKMSPRHDQAPAGYEDFRVGALEGLWRAHDGAPLALAAPASAEEKDSWSWTLLMRQPSFVDAAVVERFRDELKAKKPDNPAIDQVRFVLLTEGECVQCLHVGPYSTEAATVKKMKRFAESAGKRLAGTHHEIYLGDPRRAKPENLRTVLRCSVT